MAKREAVRADKETEREFEKIGLAHDRQERQAKRERERDHWNAEKKIKLKEFDLRKKELEKETTGQFQYRRIL